MTTHKHTHTHTHTLIHTHTQTNKHKVIHSTTHRSQLMNGLPDFLKTAETDYGEYD